MLLTGRLLRRVQATGSPLQARPRCLDPKTFPANGEFRPRRHLARCWGNKSMNAANPLIAVRNVKNPEISVTPTRRRTPVPDLGGQHALISLVALRKVLAQFIKHLSPRAVVQVAPHALYGRRDDVVVVELAKFRQGGKFQPHVVDQDQVAFA